MSHEHDEVHEDIRKMVRRRLRIIGGVVVALTVALNVAPAVAGGLVHTSDIANGAVTAPKLHADAVTTSKVHDGAISRPKISNGAIGPEQLGPQLVTARAFGTIWWSGTSVTNNRNISTSNVTHPADGVYCVRNLPFEAVNAVATPSFGWNAFHSEVHVWAIGPNQQDPCPANTQVQIRVYETGTTTPYNGNFNLVIY